MKTMNKKDASEKLDEILISDLQLNCIIGVNDWERKQKQKVIIDIVIYADLSGACETDRTEDTVNYKELKERVIGMVDNSNFYLVERLAGEIARICLAQSLVEAVMVRVNKPGALTFARTVGVEIFRAKEQ